MILEFNLFAQEGFNSLINMVYKILDIIRIVVPIGLIIMTTLDVTKKIINPEDKEGQKKIMIRAIAALIVFLLPTIIRLVMRISGMDEAKININSSGSSEIINSITPPPTINPNLHINNIVLTGCPSDTKKFHKNEIITLNTDIPSTYIGNIRWSVNGAEKYINVRETNGGKSLQISVLDVVYDTDTTITIDADGKKASCKINLEKEKLSSIEFLNCPSSRDLYLVGKEIELKTNIPTSFASEITWKVDDTSVASIKESIDKRNATIKLLTRPMGGTVFVTVVAGGSAKTCHINIKAVEELEISNCPGNKMFHVGDKITLTSNLPSSYNGPIEWAVSSLNNDFKITPSKSKKEAIVEILSVPTLNYGTVIIAADMKSTNCKIYVE